MTLEVRGITIANRLEAITTALQQGEIIAICGPNGAGKSTLLAALAGLLDVDAGEVLLDRDPLSALPPRKRAQAIGYLPQSGEVAWDVSVASLAALGRLPHGDAGKFAIASALAATDMSDFAARPVSTLSGGEKARALLARVLAGTPRWILADEPLAALDLSHQLNLLKVLRAQARQGAGVVLVVHDLAVAMNHADRVLVLDKGRLAADGKPEDTLDAETIARVWSVDARWLGQAGERALVTQS
ncbi:ABC transporter ATP-binding protein [Aurantiacibacter rhizosphaerae]|uniref:ATP-binding cassette domain-containing protein n=1 Tax=Aurantiacibacter rhizosphaerae TaxID=2691582 RepID=A0A844XCV5_9SPHN|nr:ABC transporter ATP-binding protein [Aurantiacibacter rhizosphaerae]MWV28371.1 ATP-binding cassette domain-containing protein [Aurantiacibacter rhizosphaerae]